MDQLWTRLQPLLLAGTLHAAWALAVLVFGWLAAKLIAGVIRRFLQRTRIEATWAAFLSRAIYILLIIVVVLAALGTLGVQLTSVIAILGAAGLAVALAWQASLSHLASGLMIIGLRLFRVGDEIEVLGVSGRVVDIQFFHTILLDPNQVRLVLPNGKVTDNVIKVRPPGS